MRRFTMGAAALVVASIVALGPSAGAVQTDTFGLAPTDGATSIIVPPGGTTRSSVTVSNRTSAPITITLSTVSATRTPAGVFSYGTPATGLAKQMRLAHDHVVLAAREARTVSLDIDAPSTTTPVFGAITATAGNTAASGVQQRLAIIVVVTARAPITSDFHPGSATKHSSSDSLPLALVIVAVVLVAGGAIGVVLARRREEEVAGPTA